MALKPCKNDSAKTYKGNEPSPKGLGYCAHAEPVGKIRAGLNGSKWVVQTDKNGTKSWKPAVNGRSAKFPSFMVRVDKPDEMIGYDGPLDMGTNLGRTEATVVVPLHDLDIAVVERSVKIRNSKGLKLRDLHAGIKKLLAKKVSDEAKAKLMTVMDASFFSWFKSYDTIASFLGRQTVTNVHRKGGVWTLGMSA
jgi:hypothetical protein